MYAEVLPAIDKRTVPGVLWYKFSQKALNQGWQAWPIIGLCQKLGIKISELWVAVRVAV